MSRGILETRESPGSAAENRYTLQYTLEQQSVQNEKHKARELSEYNQSIFLGRQFSNTRTSSVEEFIDKYCGSTITGLEDLFASLTKRHSRPVNWFDMGGWNRVGNAPAHITKRIS